MIGLPEFYVNQEESSIIPLITFIGGVITALIGLSFYIMKLLTYEIRK